MKFMLFNSTEKCSFKFGWQKYSKKKINKYTLFFLLRNKNVVEFVNKIKIILCV